MWKLVRTTASGGNPLRRLLTFALTILASVLLATTPILTSVTHAAGGTATWNGSAIEYNGEQFIDAGAAQAKNTAQIPTGAEYYTSSGSSDVKDTSKTPVDVIYFAAGSNAQKDTNATFAQYTVDMTVTPPAYSHQHGKTTISIDTNSQSGATSCGIPSIGWMICGVSNFLAGAMDWIFNVIRGFMEVQPIAIGGSNNAMFIAWNVMRSFANIGFIIAFLLIIYSQLTGYGVDNYGIKKLMPRLIVGAVMVNISYYLCAIVVDISNIAGVSLEQLFIGIRDQVFHVSAINITWQQMMTFVLSGGTAGVIGGISLLGATGGGVISAIYLLLPALIGLLLAVLLVLVILAARQALITILIIISPLAFVAYLLPNTEKWFKKWQSTMMTMMVFFPAFSVIYGGAELAGSIILEHASSIVQVILGMIVQVAPLAISPILFRLSGNLIQGVAKQVQGINKKVQGAGAKWSKDRAELHRQRALSGMKRDGVTPIGRRNFIRNAAIAIDERNRAVADRTKVYQQQADNAYHSSDRYSDIHTAHDLANLQKDKVEADLKAHVQREINATGSQLHIANLRAEAAKLATDVETKRTAADIEEYKSGLRVATGEAQNLMQNMKQNVLASSIQEQRGVSAQFMQKSNIASELTLSDDLDARTKAARKALLQLAGGVDPNGIVRAQAKATGDLASLQKQAIENSVVLLNANAIRQNTTAKDLAKDIVAQKIAGTISAEDAPLIEAALETAATNGEVGTIRRARMSKNVDQSMLTRVIARNVGTMKEKGGFDLQANPGLAGTTLEEMNISIAGTLGEVSANNIAGVKAGFWEEVADTKGNKEFSLPKIISAIQALPEGSEERERAELGLVKTWRNTFEALNNDQVRATIGDRLKETVEIYKMTDQFVRSTGKNYGSAHTLSPEKLREFLGADAGDEEVDRDD